MKELILFKKPNHTNNDFMPEHKFYPIKQKWFEFPYQAVIYIEITTHTVPVTSV